MPPRALVAEAPTPAPRTETIRVVCAVPRGVLPQRAALNSTRTLLVEGVPGAWFDVDEALVRAFFAKFGAVEDCAVERMAPSPGGRSSGGCSDEEDVDSDDDADADVLSVRSALTEDLATEREAKSHARFDRPATPEMSAQSTTAHDALSQASKASRASTARAPKAPPPPLLVPSAPVEPLLPPGAVRPPRLRPYLRVWVRYARVQGLKKAYETLDRAALRLGRAAAPLTVAYDRTDKFNERRAKQLAEAEMRRKRVDALRDAKSDRFLPVEVVDFHPASFNYRWAR